jgi:hypothetical protein
MTTHSQARDSSRDLKVVFADLSVEQPQQGGLTLESTFMLWPQQVCNAAVDSRLILNHEMIDLAQRNLNASFSLLRRLAGARSLGEMVELQAVHFSNQLAASIGQSEEFATLTIKTALQFFRGAYPAVIRFQSRYDDITPSPDPWPPGLA